MPVYLTREKERDAKRKQQYLSVKMNVLGQNGTDEQLALGAAGGMNF